MTQQLRALAAFTEDPGSVFSIHTGWPITPDLWGGGYMHTPQPFPQVMRILVSLKTQLCYVNMFFYLIPDVGYVASSDCP